MKIENLKELEALLDLCHKKGVHTVVVGDLTVQLVPAAPAAQQAKEEPRDEVYIDPATGLPMSEDELMFYAAANADARSK